MAKDNISSADRLPTSCEYASFVTDVSKLLFTPDYSDLKLTCGDREWNVHKAVLCSRSPVFKKMCEIGMKESQEGVIHLKEDDPDVVHGMLSYAYTLDYSYPSGEDVSTIKPIVFDIYVHSIADKYSLFPLMAHAATKFSKKASDEWNTAAFLEAIRTVFTLAVDPQHGLRDTVVSVAAKHATQLFTGWLGDQFQQLAKSIPEFGGELSFRMAADTAWLYRPTFENIKGYRCGGTDGSHGCGRCFAMTKIDNLAVSCACPYCQKRCGGNTWAGWEVKDE